MNCKKCGAYLSEGAHFCGECGSVVGEEAEQREYIYCNSCGAKIEVGSSFCGECGKAIVSIPTNGNETEYLPPDNTKTNYQTAVSPRNSQGSGQNNSNVLLLVIILILILALAGGAIWFMISRYSSPRVVVDIDPIETTSTPTSNNGQLANDSISTTTTLPNNNSTPVPAQTSQLADTTAGDYLFSSDTQYITEAYLATQSQSQVRLILNEMYARHGYKFSTQEYYDYFSKKSWYTPRYTSDAEAESHFNDIERQNKNTIVKYEKSKGWR